MEGCGKELINEKTYYKRYRICLEHCNMAQMIMDGQKVRFCQQCARFHDISKFDGLRKSCRKKLQIHNERRREEFAKNPPKPSLSENSDALSGIDMDDESIAFKKIRQRSNERKRALAVRESQEAKSPTSQSECETNSQLVSRGSASSASEKKRLTLTMGSDAGDYSHMETENKTRIYESSLLQSIRKYVASKSEEISAHNFGFHATMHRPAVDSISILTRNAHDDGAETKIRKISEELRFRKEENSTYSSSSQYSNSDRISQGCVELDKNSSHLQSTGRQIEDTINNGQKENNRKILSLDITDNVLDKDSIYNGYDGLDDLDLPVGFLDDLPLMPLPNESFDVRNRNTETCLGQQGVSSISSSIDRFNSAPHHATVAPQSHPAGVRHAASMLGFAKMIPPAIGYRPQQNLVRLAMKVHGCTPDQLLHPVRCELPNLVHGDIQFTEGYIRPGCVHLTLDIKTPINKAEDVSIITALNKSLKAEGPLVSNHLARDLLVQAGGEVALVEDGEITKKFNISKLRNMPCLAHVQPVAVTCPIKGSGSTKIVLVGSNISDSSAKILARQGGRNLTIEIPEIFEATSTLDSVEVGILGLHPGCVELEVEYESVLCRAKPLLVLPASFGAAAAEIKSLEVDNVMEDTNRDAFLRDIGFVVQYLDSRYASKEGRIVPQYSSISLRLIEKLACNLVAATVARGWVSTTSLLLEAVQAAGQSRRDAANMMDSICPDGSTLLHIAVGTGVAALVRLISEWGLGMDAFADSEGVESKSISKSQSKDPKLANKSIWTLEQAGSGGVTPLHVAALLPIDLRKQVRKALSDVYSTVDKLWNLVLTEDNLTPRNFEELFYVDCCKTSGQLRFYDKSSNADLSHSRNEACSNLESSSRFGETFGTEIMRESALEDHVLAKINEVNPSQASESKPNPLETAEKTVYQEVRNNVKGRLKEKYISNMFNEVNSALNAENGALHTANYRIPSDSKTQTEIPRNINSQSRNFFGRRILNRVYDFVSDTFHAWY